MLLLMHLLISRYLQRRSTKPEICTLTFTTASSIPNTVIFHTVFSILIFLIVHRIVSYFSINYNSVECISLYDNIYCRVCNKIY